MGRREHHNPAASGPIRIHMGRQREGCAFDLHPTSRRRILEAYPEAEMSNLVFIGYDRDSSSKEIRESVLKQVAWMLTGLTPEQLQAMGGVVIFDAMTEAIRPMEALAS